MKYQHQATLKINKENNNKEKNVSFHFVSTIANENIFI